MLTTSKYIPSTTLSIVTGYFCNSKIGYSFGFNGQEKDNEVAGTGNIMTAEFWEYDARLGRRWNVDPVVKVWESLYACFSNNPIYNVDHLGENADGYIDEDGNYLGDDGNTESHETRVVEKSKWDEINKNKENKTDDKINEKGRQSLVEQSKLLNQYEKSINVSPEAWGSLIKNGGKFLAPFVVNESNKLVFYKKESDEANPHVSGSIGRLGPKSNLYSPVDGLATHRYKDAVYKVTTGSYNIRVLQSGDIISDKHPLVNDGWIDHDKFGDFFYHWTLDKTWDPLYERAKILKGGDY